MQRARLCILPTEPHAPQTPATHKLRCIAEDLGRTLEALEMGVVQCETDTMNDRMRLGAFETQSARRIVRLKGVQTRKRMMSLNRMVLPPTAGGYQDTEQAMQTPSKDTIGVDTHKSDPSQSLFKNRHRCRVDLYSLGTQNTMVDSNTQILTHPSLHMCDDVDTHDMDTHATKYKCHNRLLAMWADCLTMNTK